MVIFFKEESQFLIIEFNLMVERVYIACLFFEGYFWSSYILMFCVHFSIPAESSRASLCHIQNVENSDYINACFVDVSLSRQ